MITPKVTEIRRPLESVTRDPFSAPPPSPDGAGHLPSSRGRTA